MLNVDLNFKEKRVFSQHNLLHFQRLERHSNHVPRKSYSPTNRDRRGRDRMVVGFTTTYAIMDCHH